MDNGRDTPISSHYNLRSNKSKYQKKRGNWKHFFYITKPGILRMNLIAVFGGFWLASQWIVDYVLLFFTLLGTLLVMASSCVFNNYLDRDLDMKMERTRNRALPTGQIAPTTVLLYGLILGSAGLGVLWMYSGVLATLFAFFGMFVYIIIYTLWLKRTSTWSTSVGGLSGAMPPVIGYVAVTHQLDTGALLLFLLLFLWQPPHFWALAIRRVEDYRAANFPLLPVVKGVYRTKIQMIPYIIGLLVIPIYMYKLHYAGWIYMTISFGLGVLWLYYTFLGFTEKRDNDEWAKKVFLYSIYYLCVSFLLLIIDTVHQ